MASDLSVDVGRYSGFMECLGMAFVEMSYLMSEECFLICWKFDTHSLRIEHEYGTCKL